ncbi:MAG: UbiD family decarboxylase [Thermodesulfobacteriota bacterium]|nr:UbiD family decarboxylase [Thermodesulfobacteriota bacterium]
MPFPHKDLREFIGDLESEGELTKVTEEVDWDLEVGAIARRLCELTLGRSVKAGGQRAALFEKIRGYPEGFRICTATLANYKRFAMMIGHKDPDVATVRELQDLYLEKMGRSTKPNIIGEAPCKENRMIGDEVDLYKFPAPMIHDGDGGRYLCTFHIVASKDRNSGWINWGMYRAMIHDRRSLSIYFSPGQQGLMMYQEYEARNEAMPLAIAIGSDVISLFISGCKLPVGISEMDTAGGLRGRPLDVVRCETNDLLVPASSEIVLEGFMPPHARLWEGPFGEYPGYAATPRDRDRPVFIIQAITFRDNPILTMSNMGVPVDEGHLSYSIAWAAEFKKYFAQNGLPVVDVNILPTSSAQLVVISTKTPRAGIAHLYASAAELSWRLVGFNILVVNDDVDVFNPAEVVHVWATRVHPDRIYPRKGPSNPLFAWGNPEERVSATAPAILYDATWPVEWPSEFVPRKSSFRTIYPQEVQEKVERKWIQYGFE